MRRWRRGAAAALFWAACVPPAGALEGAWDGPAEGEVRLLAATAAAGPDGRLEAGIEFRLAPGWKTYWRDPGEAGVPPRFDWSRSDNVAAAEVAWPAPKRVAFDGLDSYVYGNGTILPVAVRLARPGEAASLRLGLEFGVCREVCIPVAAELVLDLAAAPAAPSPAADRLAAWRARVPRPAAAAGVRALPPRALGTELLVELEAERPFVAPDLLVEAPPPWRFGRPRVTLGAAGGQVAFRLPVLSEQPLPADTPLTLTLLDGADAVEIAVRSAGGR